MPSKQKAFIQQKGTQKLNKGWSLFSATMFKKKNKKHSFSTTHQTKHQEINRKIKDATSIHTPQGKIAGGSRKN